MTQKNESHDHESVAPKVTMASSITVNLALIVTIVLFSFKGSQWITTIDNGMGSIDRRMASIEQALLAATAERWRAADSVLYHALVQSKVDAWAAANNLSSIKLPDPKSVRQ